MNFIKLATNVISGTKNKPFVAAITQMLPQLKPQQNKRFASCDEKKKDKDKKKKKKEKKEHVMFIDEKGVKRMQELQKKFQTEDGLPIFLKNGILDQILYRSTLVLCAAGLIGQAHFIYSIMH